MLQSQHFHIKKVQREALKAVPNRHVFVLLLAGFEKSLVIHYGVVPSV